MDNNISLIEYTIFNDFPEIFAFTTTKKTCEISNIRFSNSPQNKRYLAQKIQVDPENLIFPKQTHTNCVAEITGKHNLQLNETDALVTNVPGICIAVQTADCVPILLFDPVCRVIAAVHAGWRGTAKRIVEKTILKMSKYGCIPKNVLAATGPSISMENYEVGQEVISEIGRNIPNAAQTFQLRQNGKYLLNLWKANAELMQHSGIQKDNIQILGECSYKNTDKYFSARRDGMDTGRMLSGIMLRR